MIKIERLPHPDYLSYPKRQTTCFFNNEEQARNAIDAILRLNYKESDLKVFEGEHGLAAVDAQGNLHSSKEAWARWAQKFMGTGEWNLVEEADIELRKGHILLSVLTLSDEAIEEVSELMYLNGGHSIRYINPLYSEEITTPEHRPG